MRCVVLLAFTILIGIGWAFTDSFQDYADRRIVEYKIVDKGIAGGVNVWIHYTTVIDFLHGKQFNNICKHSSRLIYELRI